MAKATVSHSAEPMNAVRDAAFSDFRRLDARRRSNTPGVLFEPAGSLEIPVDLYEATRCDVPNLSTSLYFYS